VNNLASLWAQLMAADWVYRLGTQLVMLLELRLVQMSVTLWEDN